MSRAGTKPAQRKHSHQHTLYHEAKRRAAKASLTFSLTRGWVAERLDAGTCEATGIPFAWPDYEAGLLNAAGPYSASIDRIDPTKGYTPANCRLVVWIFNRAKYKWGDTDMVRLAAGILRNARRLTT